MAELAHLIESLKILLISAGTLGRDPRGLKQALKDKIVVGLI